MVSPQPFLALGASMENSQHAARPVGILTRGMRSASAACPLRPMSRISLRERKTELLSAAPPDCSGRFIRREGERGAVGRCFRTDQALSTAHMRFWVERVCFGHQHCRPGSRTHRAGSGAQAELGWSEDTQGTRCVRTRPPRGRGPSRPTSSPKVIRDESQ